MGMQTDSTGQPGARLKIGAGAAVNELFTVTDYRVGIGTGAPTVEVDVVGGNVESSSNTAGNGSEALPAFTFNGNTNTGFYSPGVSQFAFSLGGTARVSLDSSDLNLTTPWRGPNGTAAAPAYSFSGSATTGVNGSVGNIRAATAGVTRLTLNASSFTATLPWRGQDGALATPALSFSADTNTGLYRPGTDSLGFVVGGKEPMRITAAGYVGLKNTDPEQGFDIHAGTVQVRRVTNATAVATLQNSNLLQFQGAYWTTVSNSVSMRLRNIMSAVTPQYRLSVEQNAGTALMSVRNDGRVAIGNTTFGQLLDITGNMAWNGQLLLPAGSVNPPSYAFSLENGLGVYNPGADRLGFASNVVNTLEVNTNEIKPFLYWRGQSGTAAAPAVSFSGDTDTGMYYAATLLGFSALGTARLTVAAAGLNLTVPLNGPDGTKAAPAFSFINGTDTGFYKPATGFLGLVAAGNETFRVGTSSVTSTVPWRGTNGTAASPAYAFSAEDGNGLYRTVANSLYIATNGGERFRFNAVIATSAVVLAGETAGGAAAPAFAFTSSPGTGLYYPAANSLALATNGVERMRIDASGNAGFGPAAAAPEARVDVGGGNLQVRRIATATSGATMQNSNKILLQGAYWNGSASTNQVMQMQNIVSAVTPRYRFSVQDNAGNERFSVRNDGHIGISSTTPMYEVSVTGDIKSSGVRYSALGAPGTPSYTFFNDQNTGFYSPGAEQLSFAVNGTPVLWLDTSNITRLGRWSGAVGAVATPGYSFAGDPNTGIYHAAADTLNFGTGGILRLTLTGASQFLSTLPLLEIPYGTAAAPSFSFTSQTNTGIYRYAANTLGLAIAGNTPLTISNSLITSAHTWMLPNGTQGDPALSFTNNDNTGFLRPFARQLGISGGGTTRFTVDHGISSGTLPLRGANGSAAAPAFSFLGDTDTGIYRQGTNAMSFATAGIERLRVDASGNMGFGLAGVAPAARVEVGGGHLQVRRTANALSGATLKNSNMLMLQGAYWNVLANALAGMRVVNVMNTTSPQYKLSVQDNAGTERFMVRSDGKVGISSAAPVEIMGVNGNVKASGVYYTPPGSASAPPYSFIYDTNTGFYSPGAEQVAFAANGTAALWADTSFISRLGPWVGPVGAVATPSYSFAGDPNTGIYHPAADNLGFATGGVRRLTLTTASQFLSTLPLIGGQGSAAAPSFSFLNDPDTGMFSPGADRIAFATGGVERFRIYGTSVAIGMGGADPAYALQLGADSAGKPTTNTWTIASDRRLKTDITPIRGALDKLASLEGVTYRWKDPASQGNMKGTYMGIIAQDAEKIFPEWVSEDSRGYKTLNTVGFHGLLPEALRELKQRNIVLRQKLEAQKARLERLKERIR
jgi:hypothetical protein